MSRIDKQKKVRGKIKILEYLNERKRLRNFGVCLSSAHRTKRKFSFRYNFVLTPFTIEKLSN